MDNNQVRTLSRNKISTFIMRIDLDMNSNLDYEVVNEKLRGFFPNVQTQIVTNVNINLDNDSIEKVPAKKFIYSIEDRVKLELSPIDKAIIFSSGYYTTKEIYEERLRLIVEVLTEVSNNQLNSRRIGMRYINSFPSIKDSLLPSVLNSSETKILKESLSKKDNLSRIIMVDEYFKGDYRTRVQYGIPNKFYPNVITIQDIILDIDVYTAGLRSVNNWFGIIEDLNHAAYDTFLSYVREDVIESLR